jgi:hypothetical protein
MKLTGSDIDLKKRYTVVQIRYSGTIFEILRHKKWKYPSSDRLDVAKPRPERNKKTGTANLEIWLTAIKNASDTPCDSWKVTAVI